MNSIKQLPVENFGIATTSKMNLAKLEKLGKLAGYYSAALERVHIQRKYITGCFLNLGVSVPADTANNHKSLLQYTGELRAELEQLKSEVM